MKPLLSLIRVKQWVKNLFLFIPAFFAGILFDSNTLMLLVPGFFSFSFVASAIYILNDFRDIEADRNHPKKKSRPLAAGTVSIPVAFVVLGILLVTGFSIGYLLSLNYFFVLCIYFSLNLGYSLGLKNISILDILIVASGFLLRTIAGGLILNVPMTNWLLIMVFLLALFMALAKRLDDFIVNEQDGVISRKTVKHYNLNFIHSGITMLAGIITVSYIMYTISDDVKARMHSEHLYFTSIFVVAGILRYLQITLVEMNSGSPTKILLTDKFILITLAGWVLSFFIIIYSNTVL
ncbi:MAG: decaprenyl-phosphate phosphoribosyltransferase [Cyclobacteriaceae bacterium]|nr:decaprenyl-phosphate phosphoribosyltransferase [Cyclobacteriaceae bacterium]